MLKRLTILLLEFIAGLVGNLLAGYIQQDAWQNLFTPTRLTAAAAGAGVMLVVIALLENELSLAWNWWWHRIWYLRALAKDPELRRWETDFARLKLAHGRFLPGAEVLAGGERRDMVATLFDEVVKGQDGQGRILVLGEPGSGKTTGLERLTWELARRGARRLGWRWRLPVLLRLGNYQDGALLDFAGDDMRHAVGGRSGRILSHGLETLLEKGRVVLLCDALDEALGERRELVLAEIARLLQSRVYADTPVIITARTREDPGNRLAQLRPFTIQDLNDDAVHAFVRVYRRKRDDETDVRRRLEQAGLLEPGGLGRNPFWLRLVVQSGAFQGRKGQILSQAVQLLLHREWEKPVPQRSGWQRVLPKEEQLAETHQALQWLAYQMSVARVVALPHEDAVHGIVPTWLEKRSSAGRLRPADIVGLGRDAQLLIYAPGPLRFRHRLIQEALTAQLLAANETLREDVVERYAADTAWWESLIMLGQLAAEPAEVVTAIMGNGRSETRLLLATAIFQGIDEPAPALRQRVLDAFGRSLAGGVTQAHRTAVRALAAIVWDDAVSLLGSLLLNPDDHSQRAALELLLELDSRALQLLSVEQLTLLLRLGDARLQSEILQVLAARDEADVQSAWEQLPEAPRAIWDASLATMRQPQPGAGVVVRNGLWVPDIVWGGRVPAGTYPVGGDKEAWSSSDPQQIPIDQPYQLARYPVTYAQFACFAQADDFGRPRWWEGMPRDAQVLAKQRFKTWNHPRNAVSWYQAIAFCRWLSDRLGVEVDLPHEYEWEVAARWPDGRFYPWGNEFNQEKANTWEGGVGGTTAVGLYAAGKNPALALYDLSGNVWEWCRNKYESPHETAVDHSSDSRALRGGSWPALRVLARAASPYRSRPEDRFDDSGFRLVVRGLPSHHDL